MKHTDSTQIKAILTHIIDQLNGVDADLKIIKRKVSGTSGRKRKDLTGQRFGKLTAIRRGEDRKTEHRIRTTWVCQCDCGEIRTVYTCNLTAKQGTRSCGCGVTPIGAVTHGHTLHKEKTPTYVSYNCMRTRCECKTHDMYYRYGGRGITVCERWKKFENFLEDMGERPDGCELHRIDHSKGYEPGNVEWKNMSKHRSEHKRKDQ